MVLERALSIHGNKYSYENVVYTGCFNKVDITCTAHGNFSQQPNAHIGKQKQGCPQCHKDNYNKRMQDKSAKSALEFSEKAGLIHENWYDYSKVNYTRSCTEVEIICPNHGSFWQTPNAHLSGKGCRSCNLTGFNEAKPAKLYLLKCENYFKIGITNRPTATRLKNIVLSSGLQFTIVQDWTFEKGNKAFEVEQQLLSYFSSVYSKIDSKFCGSTECFVNSDIDTVKDCIENYLCVAP